MKKSILLIILALTASVINANAQWDGTSAPWTQGCGTPSDPYLIENAQHLAYLAQQVNSNNTEYSHAYYRLTSDIDLSNRQWTPIGIHNTFYSAFYGHFDGGGHKITGLYINTITNGKYIGLFGYGHACTIKNLIVEGSVTNLDGPAGGIIGRIVSSTNIPPSTDNQPFILSNLENRCTVAAQNYLGGIVAMAECESHYDQSTSSYTVGDAVVERCINKGNLNLDCSGGFPKNVAGGIVANLTCSNPGSDMITQCGNIGAITATGGQGILSGILGDITNPLASNTNYYISYCFNTGDMSGGTTNNPVEKHGISSPRTKNSYSACTMSGVGPAYGVDEYGECQNSYYEANRGVNMNYSGTGDPRTQNILKHSSMASLLNVDSTVFVVDQGNINGGYLVFKFMVPYDIQTDAATDVGSYSATLHGHYSGAADSIGFRYGLAGSASTITTMPASGTAILTVIGLLPANTYQFMFCAFRDGTIFCADSLFFTTYPLHTVTAISADVTMGNVSGEGIYGHGETACITATPAAECQFNQWNDGTNSNPRYLTVESDMNLVATFGPKQYTICVASNDDTYGSASGSGTYTTGLQVTLTATPTYGHHFVQWSDGMADNPRTFVAHSDVSLTAIFAPNDYTISASSNNMAMGIAVGGGTYPYGSEIVLTAIPMYHHRFAYWDDGPTDNPRQFNVVGDTSIVAVFEEKPRYQIATVSDNPLQGTAVGGGTFYADDTIIITAIAANGYYFSHWSDNSEEPIHPVVVSGIATYTAYFSPLTYTVGVYSNNDNLGTTSGGGEYEMGQQVTVTATPFAGARFVQWSNNATDNPYTFTIYGDVYLIATFEPAGNQGIECIDNDSVSIVVDGHTVAVSGGKVFSLYDLSGKLAGVGKDRLTVSSAGLYVLHIGDAIRRKIIIM